ADSDRPALAAFGKQALRRVVEHRAECRDERFQRVDEALRIGATDDDAEAVDDLAQGPVALLCRLAALLGKAGADHDRGAHTLASAFLERRHDVSRWHDDDSEVGYLRQF